MIWFVEDLAGWTGAAVNQNWIKPHSPIGDGLIGKTHLEGGNGDTLAKQVGVLIGILPLLIGPEDSRALTLKVQATAGSKAKVLEVVETLFFVDLHTKGIDASVGAVAENTSQAQIELIVIKAVLD